jgi:GTP-binding protein
MRVQTEAAIAEADVVLFVIDARAGLLPADRPFGDLARRSGKPIVLVANKAEGGAGMAGAYEAFALGLGEPIAISAEHGEGMGDLADALAPYVDTEVLDEDDEDADAPREDRPIQVAVVGRPNAGKSTLINQLLGEERLLTGPEAGITRDAIAVDWSWRGRAFKLFDTAGLRKRARVEDKLEKLSVADALRAVQFAEIVVVLLDATIPFEKQDLSIVDLVEKEGRALVMGLNKWDLVADQPGLLKELREKATRLLPQVRGAPVVPLSGLAGEGLDRLMQGVVAAYEVWNRRIATARLNTWLADALAANPPPAVSGRRVKIRYATQIKARPPHFALFGNQLEALPKSYTRYLVNGLRETFDLPGVPIRLSLRTGKNPYDKGR